MNGREGSRGALIGEQPVVIVTGASSGLGIVFAKTLARRGYRVYAGMRDIAGRNRASAEETRGFAEEHNLAIDAIELNVDTDSSVEAAVEYVVAETGRVDVAISNAGVMAIGVTESFDAERFGAVLNTNVLGVIRLNRAVLPHMRAQRSGLLVHVTSIGGRLALPYCTPYCASKWALEAIAEAYRVELSSHRIDSVILQPGPFTSALGAPGTAIGGDEDRNAAYGEEAALATQFQHGFTSMMEDNQTLADALADLIDQPAGTRPLRTCLGQDLGAVRAINELVEPYAQQALTAIGLGDRAAIRAASPV